MITALRAGEIDVGIGLTEGWVAGLGKAQEQGDRDGGFKLVGTYVETPLCEYSLTIPSAHVVIVICRCMFLEMG